MRDAAEFFDRGLDLWAARQAMRARRCQVCGHTCGTFAVFESEYVRHFRKNAEVSTL